MVVLYRICEDNIDVLGQRNIGANERHHGRSGCIYIPEENWRIAGVLKVQVLTVGKLH